MFSKLSIPEYTYINIKGQSPGKHLLNMPGINKRNENLKRKLIKLTLTN